MPGEEVAEAGQGGRLARIRLQPRRQEANGGRKVGPPPAGLTRQRTTPVGMEVGDGKAKADGEMTEARGPRCPGGTSRCRSGRPHRV